MTNCVNRPSSNNGCGQHQAKDVGARRTTDCGCSEKTALGTESQDNLIRTTSSRMTWCDMLGGWKVRWGVRRMSYRVDSGLYAIGTPDSNSPVLVTANYKLTFDAVRRELHGLDAWILVLDTKGVNVWCAAGKGTFGTDELVYCIAATELERHVQHRVLVLPQLGATGVSAHEIKEHTGWRVIWGPVFARDIRAFLAAGMSKSAPMRTVSFELYDRAVLVPVELVHVLKWLPHMAVSLAVLALPWDSEYGPRFFGMGLMLIASVVAGAVAFPLLLPLLPFRAFALKGLALGVVAELTVGLAAFCCLGTPVLTLVAVGLPAITLVIWLAMNFTGATTFTSQTGATLELKLALKPLIVASGTGLVLAIVHLVWSLIA
jgi:hypothetical protein